MTARVKLRPGQKGTKSLVAKYGDALLCVRYRYDSQNCTCLKTIELIIERKPWIPPPHRFSDSTLVPVPIAFAEKTLREQAKAAQGKWDPAAQAWYVPFGKIRGTKLEKLIILETKDGKKNI